MNYENYIELYEAIYFFNRINSSEFNQVIQPSEKEKISNLGLNESIYKSVLRILVVNNLLDYSDGYYILSDNNIKEQLHILENIINKDPNKQFEELFRKATNETQFFFDNINTSEYEIYSRCNFPNTFRIGKVVGQYIDLSNKKVIELGGNSGGLGSALLTENENCHYTIVDTEIPCKVGNEFNEINELNILFLEDDVFELSLSKGIYDYVIIMNLLHDFDDRKCLDILQNSIKHCDKNTKFIIIEDILEDEFQPKEVVMHGLRLSVECRGGKQRTEEEFVDLFSELNYELEDSFKLNNVHTMLIMNYQDGINSSILRC